MKKSLVCLLFCFSLIHGQTDKPTPAALKAIGAPNAPRVDIAWNRYYDSHEIGAICRRLERAFPEIVDYDSIGHSFAGRPLHLLTVTNRRTGSDRDKPAMYIDGNIHSNEVQGGEVALYTAWFLAEQYGKINWITDLVDHKTFYIVPTINPDARDYFIHEANSPHSPRSGVVPRDDDGDGLLDEDGPDDLDKDGNIVMMRRRDANGRWKPDPDDPRLLLRCKPDEKGSYELLGEEGIDNDGDGQVNEDGVGYYDPNRNWGWNWQPCYTQDGADQYPFSIPENRRVAEFVLAHPNICGAQSYHNSGGMILRGPGAADDAAAFDPADIRLYDFLGKLGEEMLPGYNYLVIHKDLYTVYGGELDWFYAGLGVYTFSNELWTSLDYFRKQEKEKSWFGSQKDTYRFDRLLLFGEGIVEWKPYRHPQYGDVEIGGVKKAWTRTAPSFMLEDLCHRNMAFTLFHGYHLPQPEVDSVLVAKTKEGLYQVDVILANRRVLPTRSYREAQLRFTRPDYVYLKNKVIAGFIVQDRFMNIVTEQKYQPQRLAVEMIPGMATVHVRWLLATAPPYELGLDSAKGGRWLKTIGR